MSKGWGGSQPKVRSSFINSPLCIGKHNPMIEMNKEYHHVFQKGDVPPIHDPSAPEYDVISDTETETITLTKQLLIEQPKSNRPMINYDSYCLMKVKQLQDVIIVNGLEITKTKIIKEGFVGKPKGLLQICHERGLLDPLIDCKKYCIKAPTNALGVKDTSLSLTQLLLQCKDFMNEMCQLGFVCHSLGCDFDLTPKCHPEMAGEGIEYLWGFMKKRYRRDWTSRDSAEQTISHFRSLVSSLLNGCGDGPVSVDVCQRMAGRARLYMVTYALLEKDYSYNDILDPNNEGFTHEDTEKS